MERIQVLIERLAEQRQQNASAAQMLVTVQLLQKELLLLQQKETSSTASKVTVVMPFNNTRRVITDKVEKVKPHPEKFEEKKPEESKAPVQESPYMPKEAPALINPAIKISEPARTYEPVFQTEPNKKPVTEESIHLPFDPAAETPTLLQHHPQPKKEIYELKTEPQEPQSLNDKLKQEKVELGHILKEAPIKDLRKAIGINDKFVFVSELFRGDEAMYDRSIKTINNFNILPEAEYWINRELKVKLGWDDSKDVVQHFYHLVRRRFA